MFGTMGFWREIRNRPEQYYIVHYSSEGLYDEDSVGISPKITSIVVMHFATRQAISFTVHAIAEEMNIEKTKIFDRYNEIELKIIEKFYEFVRDRRANKWIHWNMRNITFGFEHIEHRYRVLCSREPPVLPVEQRVNLNDALIERYGYKYAPDPRMKNLMSLNGSVPVGFLDGREEAAAFKRGDFIRMHNSTLSKVGFFNFVIKSVLHGKLNTSGKTAGAWLDRALESRTSKVVTLASGVIGVPGALAFIFSLLR